MGLKKKRKAKHLRHRHCQRQIQDLKVLLTQALERIDKLEKGNQKLRVRLHQNSSNSSRPPSSDFPHRNYPKRKSSGKKRGGQKGHAGHYRPLVPPEHVTETKVLKPTHCQYCQSTDLQERAKFIRQQKIDIPEIQPVIIEYRRYIFRCRSCGKKTVASLPPGVSPGLFGPGVHARVASATGHFGLSKQETVDILQDWFGLKISVRSVVACEKAMSQALLPAYEEAQGHLEKAKSAHFDETGARESWKNYWLWVGRTKMVVVFKIDPHRSREAFQALAKQFQGIPITDRYSVYGNFLPWKRQVCLAHIQRDFAHLKEFGKPAEKIGQQGVTILEAVFHQWHRFRSGLQTRAQLRQALKPLQEVMHGLLEEGTLYFEETAAKLCRSLLKIEPSLWTFSRVTDVEPTNNAAEQALRPLVIYRKTSYGTQSESGSRYQERIRTVVQTLIQQKQNVITFLKKTIQAYFHQTATPRLVPQHAFIE